jgi:NADH dehydrogenase
LNEPYHVVVVGGGFGGLKAVRSLRGAPVRVTLVDKRNHHLFQPLLYQVATAGLSPGDIATPLRGVLNRQRNARVILGDVVDIDPDGKKVILKDGELGYDALVVATGARHTYFGHDDWEPLAPGLKTVDDATEIRKRILVAFEAAERESDRERIAELLTFVVVGGGPTGVELAGAVAELARDTIRHDFRRIDPAAARVILVEGVDRILPAYPRSLSERAARSLERLGVTVRTDAYVVGVSPGRVAVGKEEEEETIRARTVLWSAGIQASRLGKVLEQRAGARLDKSGRVHVNPDLGVPGHPDLFVIGDLARFEQEEGEPLPAMAPVAVQEGEYVARHLADRLAGKTIEAFRYKEKGSMATIGRHAAVAVLGRFRFWGYPAWLVWLFVHLMQLVGFENRMLVFVQWAWNYVTHNRSARLITGGDAVLREGPREREEQDVAEEVV